VLQVAGTAALRFGDADPDGLTGGTGRFWELRVDAVRDGDSGTGVSWEYLDASAYLPRSPAPRP